MVHLPNFRISVLNMGLSVQDWELYDRYLTLYARYKDILGRAKQSILSCENLIHDEKWGHFTIELNILQVTIFKLDFALYFGKQLDFCGCKQKS